MTPLPISLLASRSVTFASTSPLHTLRGSLAAFGRSASILQGELYGILVAALFACSSSPPLPIYSDHLNAIHLLCNALQNPPPPYSWASLPAHSLYHWILSVLCSFPLTSSPSLIHVHAHMGATDPASVANDFVDSLTSGAQTSFPPLHLVPLPTFFMDKFTPYLPPFHFIDSHLPALLDSLHHHLLHQCHRHLPCLHHHPQLHLC